MKRFIAITLAVLVVMSALVGSFVITSAASGITLSYSFSGDESAKAGFAQGTISLKANDSASAGTYYLYWADNTKALDGYRALATLTVSNGSTATFTMTDHTAIPPQATQLIATKSSTDKSVAGAAGTYSIPASKRLKNTSALYTFGAISDPQLANDSYGGSSYPNDETHLKKAFETLAQRKVDFTVSSGDTVNDQDGGKTYLAEYEAYLEILGQSSYDRPIYEANGNHDVHVVWGDTGKGTPGNYDAPFIMSTGLDSDAGTINKGKPYFEVTEPQTGDHFIFMALEGGFRTNENTQFSTAQLDWLEGLLKKYNGDGKNIFIIEHANVAGWGSGDKTTAPYYYDLALLSSNANVERFINLMQTYKECVIITGHTHLELSAQHNFSDNNGTSAVMMHNSAIGGVRRLVDGKIDRSAVLGMSEGYIVDVYEDCIIFNGTNMYYNEIMPACTYIIPFGTSAQDVQPTETPTEKPTETPTETPTEKPTETPTEKPTQAPTVKPTEAAIYGDVDLDGSVAVTDATWIQRAAAMIIGLYGEQLITADVDGSGMVDILDATLIQRYMARIITVFPVEEQSKKDVASVSANDISALKTTVKNALADYSYASFDQYLMLKRCYNEINASGDTSAAAYDKLNSAYANYLNILDGIGANPGSTIDIYFTNTLNWSKVNAYIWNNSTKTTNATWPGSAMTLVGTNDYGQKVYKCTVTTGQYDRIIFNNGSVQTIDLLLYNLDNEGFYTTVTADGKYMCGTYRYGY